MRKKSKVKQGVSKSGKAAPVEPAKERAKEEPETAIVQEEPVVENDKEELPKERVKQEPAKEEVQQNEVSPITQCALGISLVCLEYEVLGSVIKKMEASCGTRLYRSCKAVKALVETVNPVWQTEIYMTYKNNRREATKKKDDWPWYTTTVLTDNDPIKFIRLRSAVICRGEVEEEYLNNVVLEDLKTSKGLDRLVIRKQTPRDQQMQMIQAAKPKSLEYDYVDENINRPVFSDLFTSILNAELVTCETTLRQYCPPEEIFTFGRDKESLILRFVQPRDPFAVLYTPQNALVPWYLQAVIVAWFKGVRVGTLKKFTFNTINARRDVDDVVQSVFGNEEILDYFKGFQNPEDFEYRFTRADDQILVMKSPTGDEVVFEFP